MGKSKKHSNKKTKPNLPGNTEAKDAQSIPEATDTTEGKKKKRMTFKEKRALAKKKKAIEKEKRKNTPKPLLMLRALYDWAECVILALSIIIFVFTFLVKIVTVHGSSMLQTLNGGDMLVVCNIGYTPKQGDIVVADVTENYMGRDNSKPTGPYIKRVIATEGQTVMIDPFTWTVYVDGKALDEPYVYHRKDQEEGTEMIRGDIIYPYTVPEGCVFLMGDNRNGSFDCRHLGAVKEKYILGKAYCRVFPYFGTVK